MPIKDLFIPNPDSRQYSLNYLYKCLVPVKQVDIIEIPVELADAYSMYLLIKFLGKVHQLNQLNFSIHESPYLVIQAYLIFQVRISMYSPCHGAICLFRFAEIPK